MDQSLSRALDKSWCLSRCQWGHNSVLSCLEFRIILERNIINFFICLKLHIHNSICECNKCRYVSAKQALTRAIFAQTCACKITLINHYFTNFLHIVSQIRSWELCRTKWRCKSTGIIQVSLCFPHQQTSLSQPWEGAVHASHCSVESTSSSAGPAFSLCNEDIFSWNRRKFISSRIINSL